MSTNCRPMARVLAAAALLAALAGGAAAQDVNRLQGYPSPDRAWAAADYDEVDNAVRSGKAALPLLEDQAVRTVFARMVDPDNLARFKDLSEPIRTRLPAFMDLIGPANSVFRRYIAASRSERPLNGEITRYQAYVLALGGTGLDLIGELGTLDPGDRSLPSLQRLASMRDNSRQVWLSSIDYLAASALVEKEAVRGLIAALSAHLPSYARVLTAPDLVESQTKVEGLSNKILDDQTKLDLAELAARIARTEPKAQLPEQKPGPRASGSG